MTDTLSTATREALEVEIQRLRALLARAGVDAQVQTARHATREATHSADLGTSRAETAHAQEDARQARTASDVAATDLAASEDLVAELRASQAQLRAVLETVPVGILLAEVPSGRIAMGNGRVEGILGHPPIHSLNPAAYGAYAGHHADGRRVLGEEWPLARIVSGETRAELEVQYERPDGARTWIAVNGEAIQTADGTTIGAVIAFRSIDERKNAEAAQDILNRELSHRLKNTLALVQSIAAQTLRNAPSLDAAREALAARLVTLGRAHDVLLAGHAESAAVADIVHGGLALHEDGTGRFLVAGPPLTVGPGAALSLGLMLHELATNAAKYGALSTDEGRVSVAWSVMGEGAGATFRLTWAESGGPVVTPPTRRGFGSRLIERGLAGGGVALDYRPEGLVCALDAPLAGFQALH